jgi:hypothetical protein
MGRCARIKPALIGSHLGWSTIAMPSDEPSVVVASGERDECGSQLFDGIEGSHPQQILFQGSDEALCDAVALGFSHEGGRSVDPQALDFGLEIAGHIVGAMIVTQLQPMRHPGRDGSKAAVHPLAPLSSAARSMVGDRSARRHRRVSSLFSRLASVPWAGRGRHRHGHRRRSTAGPMIMRYCTGLLKAVPMLAKLIEAQTARRSS